MTRTKGKHLSDQANPNTIRLQPTEPQLSWPWQMPNSSKSWEAIDGRDTWTVSNHHWPFFNCIKWHVSHTNCARTIQKGLWMLVVSLAFDEMFLQRPVWWISDRVPHASWGVRASAANSLLPCEACRPNAANKPCRELRSRTWRHIASHGVTHFTVQSPCKPLWASHRRALSNWIQLARFLGFSP